jgi:hypothetical protein
MQIAQLSIRWDINSNNGMAERQAAKRLQEHDEATTISLELSISSTTRYNNLLVVRLVKPLFQPL